MSSPSNEEVRRSLVALGVNCGPVTDSTRSVYVKKLDRLRAASDAHTTVTSAAKPRRARAAKGGATSQHSKKTPRVPSRTESDEESPPAGRGVRKPVASVRTEPKAGGTVPRAQASPRKPGRPAAADSARRQPAIAFDYSDADHGTGDDDEEGEEYSVADASANTSFALGGGNVLTRGTQPSPLRARPPIGSGFGASQIDPYRRPLASSTPTEPYRRRSPPPLGTVYAAPATPRYAAPPPRYAPAAAYVPASVHGGYRPADGRYAVARQADQSIVGRLAARVDKWRTALVAGVKRQAGMDKPAGGYQAARASYRPYSEQNRRQRWPDRPSYTKGIAWHYAGKVLLAALGVIFAAYFLAANKQQVAAAAVIVAGAAVDTVDVVYRRMILPILAVLLLVVTIAGLYYWRKRSIENMVRHRKAVFDMVEHITRVLREHSLTAMGRDDPYLPVPHIRDMIIKPADRSAKQLVWQAAVRYINECESRVSTETKLVHGRESMVWRWLDNHNGSAASSVAAAHCDGESNVSDDDLASVNSRPTAATDKVWQGHALSGESDSARPAGATTANGGGGVAAVGRSNAPSAAPSCCLKLRGLFDSRSESDLSDWPQHISDALLERIGDEASVYHVAVDKSSAEGVVYVRLADLRGALNAFRLLNGSWFAGKMVRAKFVRDERYSQRFPESQQASLPLTPSKPRHSLAPSTAAFGYY